MKLLQRALDHFRAPDALKRDSALAIAYAGITGTQLVLVVLLLYKIIFSFFRVSYRQSVIFWLMYCSQIRKATETVLKVYPRE